MQNRKAQGAFEYILMLAGIIMIVVMIVLILQSNIGNSSANLNQSMTVYNNFTNVSRIFNS